MTQSNDSELSSNDKHDLTFLNKQMKLFVNVMEYVSKQAHMGVSSSILINSLGEL